MKVLSGLLLFSFLSVNVFAQVSNIKTGLWSDPSVWKNNSVPVNTDDVTLGFDIIIDVNASCESFNSNGHKVVVNTGVNLIVLGNSATTLSAFVVLDAVNNLPIDTASMMLLYYDNKKRNIGIDYITFLNGKRVDSALIKAVYFYNGNDTVPYKKTLNTPYLTYYAASPFEYHDEASFYFYTNGYLLKDSSVGYSGIVYSDVDEYTYTSNKIIDTYSGSTDTNYLTYSNGNVQYQVDSSEAGIGVTMAATYDTHPNPFSKTQSRFGTLNFYPLYGMYLFIPQVFTKNNATIITQSDADGVYKHNVNITYGYRANGYPKTADANIEDVGSIDTSYQYKCIYVYTY